TGTPTFLVELMKGCGYNLKKLMREYATADSLNGLETLRKNPVPILYQSGYMTIKDYDSRFKTYILGFPNKEVEDGFMEFLLPSYTG
ncbi:AAA family ATPase, partial [Bacteroides caecigallinarum]|nr:AAA family ATPase [Bacteroides caecigallinarum]